jgi:nucleotide-binding universal stress UspA family protein
MSRGAAPAAAAHGRSTPVPFARVVCALDGGPGTDAAVEQAIAVAGAGSRIAFACGTGSSAGERAWRAVTRAHDAGVEARAEFLDGPRLDHALLARRSDLVVVGAHPRPRATGIVLGDTAARLVHRARGPVLVARERPLARGIVAARRGPPADRAALAAAKRLAELLGAPLSIADATGSDAPAGAIVAAANDAGLLVLGSSDLRRLRPLAGTSERVAHLAPCTVLLTRGS